MTGPKLNEASFVAGERTGTRASAKYVHASASKARVVLDLIRNLDVRSADEVLQFTERDIARTIRKVLASAVANAQHNDEQDPDELFVKACFADEGPTLRRFRPRARGRASRIRKRTCHITVIVGRMDDRQIEIVQARRERQGGTGGRGRVPSASAAARRARVEASRQRAAARKSGSEAEAPATAAPEDTEVDTIEAEEVEMVEAVEEAETAPTEVAEVAEVAEAAEPDTADDAAAPAGDDTEEED
ncbi:MAG: 50S ribosomal protein L22 [Actinomycetota bacterium]|nr:MAG: 50S ribosomal protein L22 [Actinomycetota bacterium]